MKLSFRSTTFPAITLLAAMLGAGQASGATLLGTGTLINPDDLTIIGTGSGAVLEFLDLTATDGSTVANAISTYSSSGFRWAIGSEMSALFDAFGFTYASTSQSAVPIAGITAAEAGSFVSYLGATNPSMSIGWIDDLTTTTYHTYACIGTGCSSGGFVTNTPGFWPSNEAIGVFLVRDGNVPEPATLALFGLGLAGLGAVRLKKLAA